MDKTVAQPSQRKPGFLSTGLLKTLLQYTILCITPPELQTLHTYLTNDAANRLRYD